MRGFARALDWSRCVTVESVPGKVTGAWVFRGTRMPVVAVFENLGTVSRLARSCRCSTVLLILFGQGTPVGIRDSLQGHIVKTTHQQR